jgi:hypothetical protein
MESQGMSLCSQGSSIGQRPEANQPSQYHPIPTLQDSS